MNKVISREYVEKNYIHKDKTKLKIKLVLAEVEVLKGYSINNWEGKFGFEELVVAVDRIQRNLQELDKILEDK